jgi:predicted acetyltransferase
MEAWFGGVAVSVGGIASLAIAPEARGRRFGSRLMVHLHEIARARGDALTVLYPFRQGYYARFGYAPTTPLRRLHLSPSSIPWRPELTVRRATGADDDALRACWEAAGVRRTGTLVRTAKLWQARLLAERTEWLVVEGGSGVEGYVAWTVSQREVHGKVTLVVRELAATTDAATRSLWAAVAAQRDQVAEVHVDVAADDPIDRALVDPDRGHFGQPYLEHRLGEVATGPMLRIVDLTRALGARGWTETGAIVLEVGAERFEVHVHGGRAAVVPTTAEPHLRLDAAALAAVAFGGLRAIHAAQLGWLVAADARALAFADALLALPPYFSPDPF